MKRLVRFLGISAAIAGAGCQTDRIAGPALPREPAALELRFTIPQTGNAALLIAVRGGPVDSVTSTTLELASLQTTSEYGVLVRGALYDGASVRLWVPDPGQVAAYVATVTQAVSAGYEQRDLEGYAITIEW